MLSIIILKGGWTVKFKDITCVHVPWHECQWPCIAWLPVDGNKSLSLTRGWAASRPFPGGCQHSSNLQHFYASGTILYLSINYAWNNVHVFYVFSTFNWFLQESTKLTLLVQKYVFAHSNKIVTKWQCFEINSYSSKYVLKSLFKGRMFTPDN